jgi:hypothetical protein
VADAIFNALLIQIGKLFLHRLNLELEVGQIGFQFGSLFGLGLVAALEAAISAAALAAAVTTASAVTGPVLAITGFVRHDISPFLQSM